MVTFGLGPSGLVDAGSLQVREAAREVVSSGFRPLDSLLPAGGTGRPVPPGAKQAHSWHEPGKLQTRII